MIPRTGVIVGTGGLAQPLLDGDPDAVAICFSGIGDTVTAARRIDVDVLRLEGFRPACWEIGIREIVIGGRSLLPAPFAPQPGETLGGLEARFRGAGLGAMDAVSRPFFARLIGEGIRGADAMARALVTELEAQRAEVVALPANAPDDDFGTPPPSAAQRAMAILAAQALVDAADQAVATAAVAEAGEVLAVEGPDGLHAMLGALAATTGRASVGSGVVTLAGWPGQDLRVSMPWLDARAVRLAAAAGLSGFVAARRGVHIVFPKKVATALRETGLFFFAR